MDETNAINQTPDRCEVCGRQDETVRAVVYPFVFSVVVITFQRTFAGCWCRIHRIQRWLAASLITAIFGWLGIPFGLVFTPVRLLQLARGGIQDKDTNGRILRAIAEEKLRNRDVRGAIRCFEACLLYVDDPEVKEQLRTLYRTQSRDTQMSAVGLLNIFLFSAIPIGLAVTGIFVGLIDYILQWFSLQVISEIPILLLVMLQVPFVILVYFCVILASILLQFTVRVTRNRSSLLISLAGVVTALLFLNGIVAGETYGIYLSYYINGFRELPQEALITLGVILTHSALYIFSPASLANNLTASALFATLLLLSSIFSLAVLLPGLKNVFSQQLRMAPLRSMDGQADEPSSLPGWISLLGVIFSFVLLFIATPQKSSIDTLASFDHISVALNHANSGEFQKAIDEYSLATELNPDQPLTYVGLGYAQYYSGDCTQARKNFEKALSLSPTATTLGAHSGLGWCDLQDGNYELAKKNFQETLQIDPQNLDGHLGLAWVFLNQYDLENSRKEFESVLALQPASAASYYGLGTLYFASNDYLNALDALNHAVDLDPNDVSARIYIGAIYGRQDRYPEAEIVYQDVLKIEPNNYAALYGLGGIRIDSSKFEEGLEYYEKAIVVDPTKIDAPFGKASVLMQIGEFQNAATLMKTLDQENEYVLPTLAYLYYQMDRRTEADKLLQDAISFAGKLEGYEQAGAYNTVSRVYSSVNKFPEAKEYLELAMDSYPAGPDSTTYLTLSYILSALGDFDESEAAIRQASLIGHSELDLHLARASLLIDQQDLAGAERELQVGLQMDDLSARSHAIMAFIFNQQGEFNHAISEAETALKINPYNDWTQAQLAFAYQSTGKLNEALAAAQEAVRLNPLNNVNHYILGLCYMKTGMKPEAIAEFETFLSNYWDRAYVRDYKASAEDYLSYLKENP